MNLYLNHSYSGVWLLAAEHISIQYKKVKWMQKCFTAECFCLPSRLGVGDIYECLETFWVITAGGMLLVSNDRDLQCTG